MIQMVPLLLLLLLFHVKVPSQMLTRLCYSMLLMPLGQMKYPWLVLLRRSLWRAVPICRPNYRAHKRVCREDRASTF